MRPQRVTSRRPLVSGLGNRPQLVSPVVVIALVIVEPVDIVVQHISIARRQPLVISRLFERINDVVQKTVVETALIEIGLHFGELLFGPLKARSFLFARVSSTPDMVKILLDIREHLGPPLVAMVALIPIVIPVLCKSNRSYRCQNQHGHHALFHFYSFAKDLRPQVPPIDALPETSVVTSPISDFHVNV